MKEIQTFIIFVLLAINLHAQSVERHVIATAGGTYYDGVNNFEMDYTVGEVAVTTISTTNNTLTQGFQQPFKLTLTAVQEYPDSDPQVIVYPNPVIDQLNISIEKPETGVYRVIVYDMLGQLMADKSFIAGSGGTEKLNIDFNPYATGNYFVRIMHEKKVLQTSKIIKIK